eukprot:4698176-Alexandrium_andersonii.AAC.1
MMKARMRGCIVLGRAESAWVHPECKDAPLCILESGADASIGCGRAGNKACPGGTGGSLNPK